MIIPKKKPVDETGKGKRVSAYKEPWVLAKQVTQCFYIIDPLAEDHVIVRRGKRSIVGVDGVVDEEDYNQFDEPDMDAGADDDGDGTPTSTSTSTPNRRDRTTLTEDIELPYKRRSHSEGLSRTTKKM